VVAGAITAMDPLRFDHLAELQACGRYEDVLRESQIMLAETADTDEKASLLIDGIVACFNLGRLEEARRLLDQLKLLHISVLEGRLNAEFCEPCLLIQEKKLEAGVAAFADMLQRHGTELREQFRYLYEDIQWRRALALVELTRLTEALPILRDATSFSFDEQAEQQKVHFWLAICLDDEKEAESARLEFHRVIGFGFKNDLEEHARYRLSRLCFNARAFAQARKQLETILEDRPDGKFVVPIKEVYRGLSRSCHFLGDTESAKRYMELAEKAGDTTA